MKKALPALNFLCSVLWSVLGTLYLRDGKKPLAVTAYLNSALTFSLGVMRMLQDEPEEIEEIVPAEE